MRKLKLLDFILLAAIALISIMIVVRKTGTNYQEYKAEDVKHQEVVISYELENLRSFSIDSVHVGDKIFDEVSKKLIGTVKEIDVKETEDYIFDNDGKAHKSPIPSYYTLYIKVDAKVREDNEKILTESGVELGLNSEHKIVTQTTFFNPILLAIEYN